MSLGERLELGKEGFYQKRNAQPEANTADEEHQLRLKLSDLNTQLNAARFTISRRGGIPESQVQAAARDRDSLLRQIQPIEKRLTEIESEQNPTMYMHPG